MYYELWFQKSILLLRYKLYNIIAFISTDMFVEACIKLPLMSPVVLLPNNSDLELKHTFSLATTFFFISEIDQVITNV